MRDKKLFTRMLWRTLRRGAICSLICSLLGGATSEASPGIDADTAAAEPHKLALLVGINEYSYNTIPDLKGSVNDVLLMKELLVERFGFVDDPAHIRVLTNERATRQRIIDSIEQHLIAQARRDSIVVFHFSGHGSQSVELARGGRADESDGLDETLLPVDSGREHHPNRDIRDDELHSLLTRLTAKTSHVTFIFDSCHAGTATRSGGRTRSVPADLRSVEGDARAQAVSPLPSQADGEDWPRNGAYTLIAGAAAAEKAYEMVEGTRTFGALTWHLVQAIRASGDQATYGDVMETVKARVTARFSRQNPQLEGSGSQALVFGSRSHPPRPDVPVQVEAGGWMKMMAGQAHGVTRGSIYEIPSATPDQPPAQFEVDEVEMTTASLRRISGRPTRGVARAVEAVHRPAEWKVRVHIEGTSSMLRQLRQQLRGYGHLELVEGEKGYDLLIRQQGEEILTEEATADEISPRLAATAPDAVERLRRQVLDWVQWKQVLAIESRHASLDVEFGVVRTRGASDLSRRQVDLTLAPGDRFTLRIRNRSELPVYWTLLDLTSSGAVQVLFPRPSAEGTTLSIGPGAEWTQILQAHLPADAESVRDVLKLLVTTEPANFDFLDRASTLGPDAKIDLDKIVSEAERALARAALGVSSEPNPGVGDASPWATYERLLQVRRASVD